MYTHQRLIALLGFIAFAALTACGGAEPSSTSTPSPLRRPVAPPQYRLHSFGVLSGGSNSFGYDINNQGHAVGYSYRNNPGFGVNPVRYSVGFGLEDLGQLEGQGVAYGYGINDQDQVVGFAQIPNVEQAWLYEGGPGTDPLMQNLGQPGQFYDTYAWAINNNGVVLADCTLFSVNTTCRYTHQAGWEMLFSNGSGFDIADNGDIVGLENQTQSYNAIRWDAQTGAIQNLGTLTGKATDYSVAYAVSNNGQWVAGLSDQDGPEGTVESHGFLYANGTMTDMGHLGAGFSQALGINNQGFAVGLTALESGQPVAFLYDSRTGIMHDLNDLIVKDTDDGATTWLNIHDARRINDKGMIVGTGVTPQGQRGFIAVPVGSDG